jgi:hypothetical protein
MKVLRCEQIRPQVGLIGRLPSGIGRRWKMASLTWTAAWLDTRRHNPVVSLSIVAATSAKHNSFDRTKVWESRMESMGRDSTSTFFSQRSLGRHSVGCEVRKSNLNLFQNRREIFRVWAHVPGMIPLKVRLYAAVDPPICVPQMIIDTRVGRLQVYRLL